MKRRVYKAIAFAILASVATPAFALPEWRYGNVANVFADPSDFVIEFSVAGPCGSNFYHVKRTNANFREMVEIVLAALPRNSVMGLYVTSCAGGRNILSHGFVRR